MTIRIRRERHRSPWQHAGVRIALPVLVAVVALLAFAWRLGGPVPVKPVSVMLPAVMVGSAAPASDALSGSKASE